MMKLNELLELRTAGQITLLPTKKNWIWSVSINVC